MPTKPAVEDVPDEAAVKAAVAPAAKPTTEPQFRSPPKMPGHMPGMHGRPQIAPRAMAAKEDFAEGDYVVYPTHGVGKVERIATEEIAGHKLELIHITFEENRMTLRVPVAKARTAGLRKGPPGCGDGGVGRDGQGDGSGKAGRLSKDHREGCRGRGR